MDFLINSIARSGPSSGRVGNSMRASISGGADESTTAVLVPPMSTPIQILLSLINRSPAANAQNRRPVIFIAGAIDARIQLMDALVRKPLAMNHVSFRAANVSSPVL